MFILQMSGVSGTGATGPAANAAQLELQYRNALVRTLGERGYPPLSGYNQQTGMLAPQGSRNIRTNYIVLRRAATDEGLKNYISPQMLRSLLGLFAEAVQQEHPHPNRE